MNPGKSDWIQPLTLPMHQTRQDPEPRRAPPPSAFTLRDVTTAISRHKLLVLVLTLLGAAAGFAVAQRLTPEYTAGATLISDAAMSSILDVDRGDTAPLIDPSATATIVETVGTPVVIERALAALPPELRDRLRDAAGIEEAIAAEPDPAAAAALETPLLVRHLSQSLDVDNSGRSYVIRITYHAEDPHTAASVANAMAGAYLDYRAELKQGAYARMLQDLEREIASLKIEMREAERTAQTKREQVRLLALRSEALTGRQQEEAIAESSEFYAAQREAEREADATAAVYEQLLRTERELQSRLTAPAFDVRLFAPAVTPLEPSSFDAGSMLIALGAAGGFFAGASLAVLRARRRLPTLRLS